MSFFYVHLFGVDFSSPFFAVLIIHLYSLFGLRLRSRLQCMIIVLFLKHLKISVQFHPIADLGLYTGQTGRGNRLAVPFRPFIGSIERDAFR